MGVFFTEERGLPKQLSRRGEYGAYGANGTWTDMFTAPTDFLKSWLVDKPATEQAAQVEIAKTQAAAAVTMQQQASQLLGLKQETIAKVAKGAAIVAGIMVVGVILLKLRQPAPARVAGYRRSKRSHRRSRK